MVNNSANIYLKQKIMTASPRELTLMLYDGAIKFTNIAKMQLESNNFEKTNFYLQKTQDIILELQSTLDFKYPVANDFNNIYKAITFTINQFYITQDKNHLDLTLEYLKTIRDTWKEICSMNKIEKSIVV
jgi:flagellar protein FliS